MEPVYKRNNFRNRRVNQVQQQRPLNQVQQQRPLNQVQQVQGEGDKTNMATIIIVTFIFLVVVYVIYMYGEKMYNYINENIELLFNGSNDYILLESEEDKKEKIKCKSGCVKGKCNPKEGVCKEDDECMLCLDKDGSIYGDAPNKKDDDKIKAMEEEDVIQNRRVKELEEMIQERNKQIDDLNKYIDYVNKNKDKINKEKVKIIHEEEDKPFIIKVNYS